MEYPNLDIISLRPMYVSTPMTKHTKEGNAITPEECAIGLMAKLGNLKVYL